MRIRDDVKLDFDDVLIEPAVSEVKSRKDVDLIRRFKFKHSQMEWSGFPIIASNMYNTGTYEMWKSLYTKQCMTAIHKYNNVYKSPYGGYHLNEAPHNYAWYTCGIGNEEISKIRDAISISPFKYIMIDIANGYMTKLLDFVKRVRDVFPNLTIAAGNVCTATATEQLILAGADVVKIGIGPSLVCDTRVVTGVGYPQLSAIIETADVAHHHDAHIIADGGCKRIGDISKAFAANADFVMLGTMLTGFKENEGEIVNGQLKVFGMSSNDALNQFHGGKLPHRAAEGNTIYVDNKNCSVVEFIDEIKGGIASTCSYVGAKKLKDLSKCTTFIRVNRVK